MDAQRDDTGAEQGIPAPSALLAAAEGAINALLRLDPEDAARLASVQGRVLLVEVTGFGTRIFVIPGETGLLLYGAYDARPDCTVRGTPAALLSMVTAERREDAVFEGAVEIDGDNRVAQTLGDVFRGLDIDWEELLAKLVGDTLAHRLGLQARAGHRWATRTGDTLAQDLGEYLQEEMRVVPSHAEVRDFLDDVDSIRDDVERLEARIARLTARGKG